MGVLDLFSNLGAVDCTVSKGVEISSDGFIMAGWF
jgi:hypothetical protein